MINITSELKKKLLAAKSAEEAAELVKADGQKVTAEDAERLWEEITRLREKIGKELSPDELEAVSGGRDYLKEGCAATVEPNSLCWSNDRCYLDDVLYEHTPCNRTCPYCSYGLAVYVDSRAFKSRYWCLHCGESFEVTEIF